MTESERLDKIVHLCGYHQDLDPGKISAALTRARESLRLRDTHKISDPFCSWPGIVLRLVSDLADMRRQQSAT